MFLAYYYVNDTQGLYRLFQHEFNLIIEQFQLAPVVWGIRIQPTFALVRVVRGD